MQKELNLIIASDSNCLELASFNKSLIDDGGSNNSMTIDELEVRMRKFILNGYIAFIFEVESRHIGFALIDSSQTPIFIRQFFIEKEFRRKKYGKVAFLKLVSFLNVDRIHLTVLVSNQIGFEFWKSCGLTPYEIVMRFGNPNK